MKNGDILENLTVKLYQKMGFDVEQDIILEGKSGSIHQIDVIAKKKSWRKKETYFIECKLRTNSYVGKADVSNFLLALDDLEQKDGSVITNSRYSENALKIGERYNLNLINGEELKNACRKYGIKYNIPDCSNDPVEYLVKTAFDFLGIGKQKA